MAGMTSLIGAGVGLAGSLLGGSSQPKVRWRPMSTENLWGSTSFDKKGKKINTSLSPWAQGLTGSLQDQATGAFNDPRTAQGRDIQGGALTDMLNAYGTAQEFGMPDQSLYDSAMGGMAGIAGGMGNLFGAAMQNPYALEQMQLGRGLLGSTASSYGDVAASRLDLLRQNAQPFEERAQNSLMNKLYGMGQLGTPGGQLGMESFSRGLAQADTGRQLEAQTFAEQLYGRDLSAAIQRQGIGANMFGGGVSNYLSGLQGAANIGGMAGNAIGGMYDLGMNWNQAGYNRANDRLARTTDLFGFGSALENAGATRGANFLNILSGITGEQNSMAQLGLSAAGPGAPTGGNTTGQAVGGFLGGLGSGMLTGNIDFGSLFNRGGTMNSQGFGLSNSMLNNAYSQIGALGGGG